MFFPPFSYRLDNGWDIFCVCAAVCSYLCHYQSCTSGSQQKHMEAKCSYHITGGSHSWLWLLLWTLHGSTGIFKSGHGHVLRSCLPVFSVFSAARWTKLDVPSMKNGYSCLWRVWPSRHKASVGRFLLWHCRALGIWNLASHSSPVKLVCRSSFGHSGRTRLLCCSSHILDISWHGRELT